MSKSKTWRAMATGLLATTGLASSAFAQLGPPAPIPQTVDKNGVNLFDGNLYVNGPVLSIGQAAPQGIQFQRIRRNGGWTEKASAGFETFQPTDLAHGSRANTIICPSAATLIFCLQDERDDQS